MPGGQICAPIWGLSSAKTTIYCASPLGRTQYNGFCAYSPSAQRDRPAVRFRRASGENRHFSRSKISRLESLDPSLPEAEPHPLAVARASAIFEILLCSGIPSQLALAYMFALAGFTPHVGGRLSFAYIASLLLVDATLLIGLVFWLLRRHGELPGRVFFGARPVRPEIRLGVGLTAVVFALAVVVLSAVRLFVPSLHNVKENPLQD